MTPREIIVLQQLSARCISDNLCKQSELISPEVGVRSRYWLIEGASLFEGRPALVDVVELEGLSPEDVPRVVRVFNLRVVTVREYWMVSRLDTEPYINELSLLLGSTAELGLLLILHRVLDTAVVVEVDLLVVAVAEAGAAAVDDQ